MKKLYSLVGILAASLAFAQTPIITAIGDGDCSGGTPKVLEIYAQGTVDFSQYALQKQTNANTDWGSNQDLSDLGTVTDAFVYVYYDTTADDANFTTEFSNATTSMESTALSVNGDDRVRIIKTSDSSVIDIYGEDGVDGTGTNWEYKDGYAKRNDTQGPNATFTESEWTFSNGGLNGEGTCQGGTVFQDIIGTGTYTAAALATIDLELTNSASFIKNTIVKEELNFAAKSDVQVFDMNGKVVKSAFVSENKSLNLNDLPKGMYIVTGLVNGKKVSEKIIKK